MEKMKIQFRRVFLLLAILTPQFVAAQKSVPFSQYMANGLMINPAYAGTGEALSLTASNRKQWAGMEGGASTQTFNGHALLREQGIGFGVSIVNDKIGIHKDFQGALSASYQVMLSNTTTLSFGMQGVYGNYRADYASIAGNAMPDPKVGAASIATNHFNIGAGAYLRSSSFEAGISVPQIWKYDVQVSDTSAFTMQNGNYLLFSRYKLPLSHHVILEPSLLFRYCPGVPMVADLNTSVTFYEIATIGASYRTSGSFAAMTRFNLTQQLMIGYAYDLPLANTRAVAGPSHELLLSYLFKFSRHNVVSP